MHAAIYARVSTPHQERDQTIDSQLAVLSTWCHERHYDLADEHIYRDEGYSGARLDRPGLDALRDAARAGEFELVAILTPDRLARKYAYQVLVLEELRRAGCETVFVQRPISDDPNDQLLLQIQGAIAEYERAVLGERFRRGKLQRARAGHYSFGHAPYGYRYVPKQDSVPGHLVVDEVEADFVRMLYRWLVEEQLTIRQIWQATQLRPVVSALRATPLVALGRPPHPGRPHLHRHRLRQPLPLCPAQEAAWPAQARHVRALLSPAPAPGGLDPHPRRGDY